jgi:hypothetical protein
MTLIPSLTRTSSLMNPRKTPSRRSRIDARVIFALLASAAGVASAGAGTPVPAQVEVFYAELRAPLALAQRQISLVRACRAKFGANCELPEALSEDRLQRLSELFAWLVHAGLAVAPPPPSLASAEQAAREEVRDREELMRTLRGREATLYAKAMAIAHECPGKDSERLFVAAPLIEETNFVRFWEMSPEEFASIAQKIADETTAFRKVVREKWGVERCRDTYPVAFKVMQEMSIKTRPYVVTDWRAIPSRDRFGQSIGFIWKLAFMLELDLDPAIEKRFDAAEDARDRRQH